MAPVMLSFGLVGWPLDHSLSPQIHSAALRACGIEGDYRLFPIAPYESERSLSIILDKMRQGIISGLNVTIPYKQQVKTLLDSLSPVALKIGAVNTISVATDQLVGDNTDVSGFQSDLTRFINLCGISLDSMVKNAVVIGAGGSARAVVFALANSDWTISVFSRNYQRAISLCDDLNKNSNFSAAIKPAEYTRMDLKKKGETCSLIVNCTPVGMIPDEKNSPWPVDVPFPHDAIVYDLVYNPRVTTLMKQAQKAGLMACNGLGMLVEQAALSFELWTGLSAPRKKMMEAAGL